MIEIINKPLLLHLVGYLYYWQMGCNSVFKGLRLKGFSVKRRKYKIFLKTFIFSLQNTCT